MLAVGEWGFCVFEGSDYHRYSRDVDVAMLYRSERRPQSNVLLLFRAAQRDECSNGSSIDLCVAKRMFDLMLTLGSALEGLLKFRAWQAIYLSSTSSAPSLLYLLYLLCSVDAYRSSDGHT